MSTYEILRMTCRSGTCFSQPGGGSQVDTELALDPLGAPALSGKTLRGLWGETYDDLLGPVFDQGKKYRSTLLGHSGDKPSCAQSEARTSISARRQLGHRGDNLSDAALYVGTGRLPKAMRDTLRWACNREHYPLPSGALKDALTSTRFMTAEDRTTAVPQRESLRQLRLLPPGTVLEVPLIRLNTLDTDAEEILDLLVRLTRNVGLHRRRGYGWVSWEKVTNEKPTTKIALPALPSENTETATGTVFLPITLRLTEPCIASGGVLDENSRGTQDHLTGAMLMGAFLKDLNDDTLVRAVLVEGALRFLPGYPAEREIYRTHPVAHSWLRAKNEADDSDRRSLVCDVLSDPSGSDRLAFLPTAGLNATFHTTKGKPASPKVQSVTHIQRADVARKDDSQVFTYEALEADQSFIACLALSTKHPLVAEQLRERAQSVLNAPLLLGRSAMAGYGGLPTVTVDAEWKYLETGADNLNEIQAGDSFSIRLTSDTIVYDPETGQPDPWALPCALKERFENNICVVGAAIATGEARGFNRHWRTELPAVPCALRGSVVRFTANEALSAETLQHLQANPLGARAFAGFGAFVVETESRMRPSGANTVRPEVPAALDDDDLSKKRLIEAQKRLYRHQLELMLMDRARTTTASWKLGSYPPLHVLRRFALMLREVGWQKEWTTLLTKDGERLRQTARGHLQKGGLIPLLQKVASTSWSPEFDSDLRLIRLKYRLFPDETMAEGIFTETLTSCQSFYARRVLAHLRRKIKEKESTNA